jgi:hypothetical protein
MSEVSEVQPAKVSLHLWAAKSAPRRLSQVEMMDIKKSIMSPPGDADLPLIQCFEKNDVPSTDVERVLTTLIITKQALICGRLWVSDLESSDQVLGCSLQNLIRKRGTGSHSGKGERPYHCTQCDHSPHALRVL